MAGNNLYPLYRIIGFFAFLGATETTILIAVSYFIMCRFCCNEN
jgi:hypothetical protein